MVFPSTQNNLQNDNMEIHIVNHSSDLVTAKTQTNEGFSLPNPTDSNYRQTLENFIETEKNGTSFDNLERASSLLNNFKCLDKTSQLLFLLRISLDFHKESQEITTQFASETPGGMSLSNQREQSEAYTWMLSHLEEDPDVCLKKEEVYNDYRIYSNDLSRKPLNTADFGKVMKKAFPNVKPRRLGQRGQSKYCYGGLRKKLIVQPPSLPDINRVLSGEESQDSEIDLNPHVGASGQLLSDCCHLVLEWAKKLLGTEFESLRELSLHLISNMYINCRSASAFRLLADNNKRVKTDGLQSKRQMYKDVMQLKKNNDKHKMSPLPEEDVTNSSFYSTPRSKDCTPCRNVNIAPRSVQQISNRSENGQHTPSTPLSSSFYNFNKSREQCSQQQFSHSYPNTPNRTDSMRTHPSYLPSIQGSITSAPGLGVAASPATPPRNNATIFNLSPYSLSYSNYKMNGSMLSAHNLMNMDHVLPSHNQPPAAHSAGHGTPETPSSHFRPIDLNQMDDSVNSPFTPLRTSSIAVHPENISSAPGAHDPKQQLELMYDTGCSSKRARIQNSARHHNNNRLEQYPGRINNMGMFSPMPTPMDDFDMKRSTTFGAFNQKTKQSNFDHSRSVYTSQIHSNLDESPLPRLGNSPPVPKIPPSSPTEFLSFYSGSVSNNNQCNELFVDPHADLNTPSLSKMGSDENLPRLGLSPSPNSRWHDISLNADKSKHSNDSFWMKRNNSNFSARQLDSPEEHHVTSTTVGLGDEKPTQIDTKLSC